MKAETEQFGFTLIEVLVVAGLIALISALAIPAMVSESPDRRIEELKKQLADFSGILSEQALFNGVEYAVAFSGHEILFYQFDLEQNRFVEPEQLPLRLPDLSDADLNVYPVQQANGAERVALIGSLIEQRQQAAQAAQNNNNQQQDRALSTRPDSQESANNIDNPVDDEIEIHAIYFSNGEVTPYKLEIVDDVSGMKGMLRIDTFGKEERDNTEMTSNEDDLRTSPPSF